MVKNVLYSHVEPKDEFYCAGPNGDIVKNRMEYVVKHTSKQAVFKLGKKSETFEDIKKSIASYFGLPIEKIFLTN